MTRRPVRSESAHRRVDGPTLPHPPQPGPDLPGPPWTARPPLFSPLRFAAEMAALVIAGALTVAVVWATLPAAIACDATRMREQPSRDRR